MSEELDIKKRIEPYVLKLAEFDRIPEEGEVEKTIKTIQGLGLVSLPVLEEVLANLNAQKERILSDDIPCLLAEYGMSEATMLDGTKIGTEMYYSTSQKDKDSQKLADWLTDNGYADILKDILKLGKGEFDDKLSEFLKQEGYSYEKDSTVHPQTLKSTIKKHLEAGGELPPIEAVEVKMYQRAKVTPPKESKGF